MPLLLTQAKGILTVFPKINKMHPTKVAMIENYGNFQTTDSESSSRVNGQEVLNHL